MRGAKPLSPVASASEVGMLTDQHESNLDKSAAESKQIAQNASRYPVIGTHISKQNILAGIFLIKGQGEGYMVCTSVYDLLLTLTTAFTA